MLTQSEFDQLVHIEKIFKENSSLTLGPAPIKWTRDIISSDRKETFLLDFIRGSLEIKKYTYNKRYRQSIVLLRICSTGRHSNPQILGGECFNGPHVHVYKEGYGDKVAYSINTIGINDGFTMDGALKALLDYFNVIAQPSIQTTI